MTHPFALARRGFLRHTARLAAAALPALSASVALASVPDTRGLALVHTHTHEKIDLVYADGQRYVPAALGSLNRFLRDHYTGDVGLMDPRIFDLLHRVQQVLGSSQAFEVISGYRCPATNDHLRQTRSGGVAKHSLHMEGRAIDVRLPGVPLAALHEVALSLRGGGVGFYPREQFVHLDTGRTRNW
ncbi:MAG: twin-arginine translocation pathway signal protein [Burkholderiales bacterium RIFCSPHIGHO2_12_FULL_61_11]|nr:MAG: twin-arginine translocation pathway signal protein [Burkholderiales bacterium RIFCSPHIGHO2_12_FULL_61_11]